MVEDTLFLTVITGFALYVVYVLKTSTKLPPVPSEEDQTVTYNLSLIKEWEVLSCDTKTKTISLKNGNIKIDIIQDSLWSMTDLRSKQEIYSYHSLDNPISKALMYKYLEVLDLKEKETMELYRKKQEEEKNKRLQIFKSEEFKKDSLVNKINKID